MELIINQLSEIETASVKIIEHATEQKKEVAEHFKQLTQDFDEQVDLDTQKRLSDLNIKLTKEKEQELVKMCIRDRLYPTTTKWHWALMMPWKLPVSPTSR